MISGPMRRGEVWKRTGQTGTAIYDAETDGLHVLNPSALAIWELCDGHTSPDEMAEAIAELTGVNLERASEDVSTALEALARLGLVSL